MNQLMFVYFIQKRGLLDDNENYLRTKLSESRRRGKDIFYNDFLCVLFFDGFAKKERERASAVNQLLGKVPFFSRDLFIHHQSEHRKIKIADAAFEKLFDFFDEYDWRMDEGPPRGANEINTDALGSVLERCVNQRQMGAYYTKDDITDYIASNTIIPFLLDSASDKCKSNFDGIWLCLSDAPDRYIREPIKKGIELRLPASIAAGFNNSSKQRDWNKPAPERYALATETWREVVARRKGYESLRAKIASGALRDTNDLITCNLDIKRLALDAIRTCASGEWLRAFWQALEKLSVLDPTCGSGAFLFAAMKTLEPLYEACLDRMMFFLDEARRSDNSDDAKTSNDFQNTLELASRYSNRRLFITKSIIANNLFGVDLLKEAVEICKLRLLLKLIGQADSREQIEQIGEIDFNLCAGNALVGYVAVDKGLTQSKEDLNRTLARERGVDSNNSVAYKEWLTAHKPFHWPVEFPAVANNGGFDCIIGNPPYVSATQVRKHYSIRNYETANCHDIYAWVMERSAALLKENGRAGMIVPLSLAFSRDFDACRKLLFREYGANWFSSFARIPAALFSFDVRIRNTIHIGHKSKAAKHQYTTRLHRWKEAARPHLFQTIEYAPFAPALWQNRIPKLNTEKFARAFERLMSLNHSTVGASLSEEATAHALYFKKTAYNWLNFCRAMPPCFDERGLNIPHTKFGVVHFVDARARDLAFLLLNGKIMFAFWCMTGDDFDVTRWMFADFPLDLRSVPNEASARLFPLVNELEETMNANLAFKLNAGRRVGNYNLARCREVTDKSDAIFARLLGLEAAWPDIELLYSQMIKTDFD